MQPPARTGHATTVPTSLQRQQPLQHALTGHRLRGHDRCPAGGDGLLHQVPDVAAQQDDRSGLRCLTSSPETRTAPARSRRTLSVALLGPGPRSTRASSIGVSTGTGGLATAPLRTHRTGIGRRSSRGGGRTTVIEVRSGGTLASPRQTFARRSRQSTSIDGSKSKRLSRAPPICTRTAHRSGPAGAGGRQAADHWGDLLGSKLEELGKQGSCSRMRACHGLPAACQRPASGYRSTGQGGRAPGAAAAGKKASP